MIMRKGCIDLEVRPYLNIRSLKEGDVVDQPIEYFMMQLCGSIMVKTSPCFICLGGICLNS